MSNIDAIIQGVSILGPLNDRTSKILSKEATAFLALLHRSFNARRKELLQRRDIRQAELDKGVLPDFLPETKRIRESPAWRGAPPAPGLVDRRTEITGPTDRKMVVNALNSNVWTYMADFEGRNSSSGFKFKVDDPLQTLVHQRGTTWSMAKSTFMTLSGSRSTSSKERKSTNSEQTGNSPP